jgi:hypothetical protein
MWKDFQAITLLCGLLLCVFVGVAYAAEHWHCDGCGRNQYGGTPPAFGCRGADGKTSNKIPHHWKLVP